MEPYSITFFNLFFTKCKAQTDILKSYYIKTHANEKLHQRAQHVYNLLYFQSNEFVL